ncbi:hypothetical protein JXA88_01040 [Candidatus Fermentibacteria bacterium]|nr:hypothetical protein [Candidatus Fermentibacteria bacterium]
MSIQLHVRVLTLLEQNELAMAELYRQCATHVVEHAGFWNDLVTEEQTHALMFQVMRSLVEEGDIDLSHRESWENVAAMAEAVKREIDAIKGQTLSALEALRFADAMEQNFTESRAFLVYPNDPPELVRLLSSVANDSRRHADRIRELALRIEEESAIG